MGHTKDPLDLTEPGQAYHALQVLSERYTAGSIIVPACIVNPRDRRHFVLASPNFLELGIGGLPHDYFLEEGLMPYTLIGNDIRHGLYEIAWEIDKYQIADTRICEASLATGYTPLDGTTHIIYGKILSARQGEHRIMSLVGMRDGEERTLDLSMRINETL